MSEIKRETTVDGVLVVKRNIPPGMMLVPITIADQKTTYVLCRESDRVPVSSLPRDEMGRVLTNHKDMRALYKRAQREFESTKYVNKR